MRLKMWLQRFFYGRNGFDQLGGLTLAVALLLSFLYRWTGWMAVMALYYVVLVIFCYRLLSRQTYKRSRENMVFLSGLNRVGSWFRLRGRMVSEVRTYKYFKCPSCSQRLRAPRHRGKISVTCSKCRTVFISRT